MGWRQRLNIPDVPTLSYYQAGQQLAEIAQQHDFSFFEYWLTDFFGHKTNLDAAIQLLETFDQALAGVLSRWRIDRDLIFITSDHGNLEDLSIRGHTRNLVPGLVIGPPSLRRKFVTSLTDLTDILPATLQFFQP
jgi:phosphopentomutase